MDFDQGNTGKGTSQKRRTAPRSSDDRVNREEIFLGGIGEL